MGKSVRTLRLHIFTTQGDAIHHINIINEQIAIYIDIYMCKSVQTFRNEIEEKRLQQQPPKVQIQQATN